VPESADRNESWTICDGLSGSSCRRAVIARTVVRMGALMKAKMRIPKPR